MARHMCTLPQVGESAIRVRIAMKMFRRVVTGLASSEQALEKPMVPPKKLTRSCLSNTILRPCTCTAFFAYFTSLPDAVAESPACLVTYPIGCTRCSKVEVWDQHGKGRNDQANDLHTRQTLQPSKLCMYADTRTVQSTLIPQAFA